MNRSALFRKDPCLKLALELGFIITPGRRHWHLSHPNGNHTIASFGRKRHARSERNTMAAIKRAALLPVGP
jgi:hypothetical protein